jgi:small subunit ribosomal protein S16
MAVKLRLTRLGKTKQPTYRIVAIDSRTKRDGKYIELIGTYNPLTQPNQVKINEEVALKWLGEGAIPSDTVKNLFKEAGIMKKFAESKNKKTEKAEKVEKKETKKEAKPAAKKETKTTTKKTTTKKASK